MDPPCIRVSLVIHNLSRLFPSSESQILPKKGGRGKRRKDRKVVQSAWLRC